MTPPGNLPEKACKETADWSGFKISAKCPERKDWNDDLYNLRNRPPIDPRRNEAISHVLNMELPLIELE